MVILLDTCTFLWIINGSMQLSRVAAKAFQDPNNTVYLSSISIWEILANNACGKLTLPEPVADYVKLQRDRHGIESLPLEEAAVLHQPRLPRLHSDPFDRMLLCQALELGCAIMTPDEQIGRYPVRIIW